MKQNELYNRQRQGTVPCLSMHEQSIIDEIINSLDTGDARVIKISLMIDETNLRKRLSADIARGIRSNDVIDRSVARIDMYQKSSVISARVKTEFCLLQAPCGRAWIVSVTASPL